jgi:hypothetical protein
MQKITFLEDEWTGLVQLVAIPRRRVFVEEHVGREVLRFLIQKGLVEDRDDLIQATDLGLRVLKANPPVSPLGVRIWYEAA